MLKQIASNVHHGKQNLQRAKPTIYACVAAVGVIGTAVLTAIGTKKAIDDISEAKKSNGEMNTSDKVIIAAPHYIPAVGICTGTVMLVFASNALNKKQQATMASAYALLERSYNELRKAVIDTVGEEKFQEIRSAIVRENCSEDIFEPVTDDGVWFYDPISHRNFVRTWDEMNAAQDAFIKLFEKYGYVDLNYFYDKLNLPETEEGIIYSWDSALMNDWKTESLVFGFEKTELDGGIEVYSILYPDMQEL